MPIRLSGIASNLDTDAIIKELMNAQSLKKTKIENKLTKHQWTRDIWKDMNSKIYKFYTGPLAKLKTQGSYSTKKAVSSNEGKVTVKAGTGATTGTHNVQVKQLASAQYVTGFKLSPTASGDVTGTTTLKDLGFSVEVGKETVIQIKNGEKTTELYVNEKTTLNDFTQACSSAGLNASFDNSQKRLFISSKQSGKDNTFSISSKTVTITSQRQELRNLLGYNESGTSGAARYDMDQAIDAFIKLDGKASTPEEVKALEAATKKLNDYMKDKTTTDLSSGYETLKSLPSELVSAGILTADEAKDKALKDYTGPVDDQAAKDAAVKNAIAEEKQKYINYYQKEYQDLISNGTTSTTNPYSINQSKMINALKGSAAADINDPTFNSECLNKIGIGTITVNSGACESSIKDGSVSTISSANSEIVYNGATLEGTSNSVTVNGVTFELHGVTEASESVSLTITNDVDAVYDMIKDFVKGYNELLQDVNKLYNATSAKGYNPLTDDEKSAMTDDQIEKWEQKIKDSLLRRDDKLSGVISSMRNNMAGSVSVNGKSLSLSSFGIVTGVYTEKGILHIQGDIDDPTYGGDTDKLKKALTENPDDVMQVLSKLGDNLYRDIMDKMKSTSLSSALTIYNDKEMDKVETRYKKDLATLEKKLKEMENRYYKQFSAMETAMSKLNSQSSQLSSMLGY